MINLPVREGIGRAKYIPEDKLEQFERVQTELSDQAAALINRGGHLDA